MIGVKLDLIDFREHILLDKSSGLIRQLLFTPEKPAEFKKALDQTMKTQKTAVVL